MPFPLVPILLGLVVLNSRKTAQPIEQPKPANLPAPSTPQRAPEAATNGAQRTTIQPVAKSPLSEALGLRDYLRRGGAFGVKNKRNPEVLRVQKVLGVTGEDGIVGPKTRAATRALGVTLPPRPSAPANRRR